MKITSEPDEVAVADVIVGQYDKYNAFIHRFLWCFSMCTFFYKVQ